MLKAAGQTIPSAKPILEINAHHPIILKLGDEGDEKRFADWAFVLFDQSVLSLGEKLDDPINFVNRLNGLLTQV
jgi:molecular chaperone HtpG